MPGNTTAPTDRLAVGIMEAAHLAGVGRSTIYQSINTGDLKARKAGRRTLILRDDLQEWLASFPRIKSMPESTRRS
jgi:excisionase family DNA binding protein